MYFLMSIIINKLSFGGLNWQKNYIFATDSSTHNIFTNNLYPNNYTDNIQYLYLYNIVSIYLYI